MDGTKGLFEQMQDSDHIFNGNVNEKEVKKVFKKTGKEVSNRIKNDLFMYLFGKKYKQ